MRHPTDLELAELERRREEPGTCRWAPCSTSLAGRRKDAVYCGPPCRTDAHHLEPISAALWRRIGLVRRPARRRAPVAS